MKRERRAIGWENAGDDRTAVSLKQYRPVLVRDQLLNGWTVGQGDFLDTAAARGGLIDSTSTNVEAASQVNRSAQPFIASII